jgi:hypothetical protein
MSKKYSTDELVAWIKAIVFGGDEDSPSFAIIAKLRAGDKLYEAAKSPAFRDGVIFCESNPQMKKLRKAIASYEGKDK